MNKFGSNTKKIFWGLAFIFAAAFVILSPMMGFAGVGFWDIFWTIVSVSMLITGIAYFSPFKILFSLAILGIVYAEQLGIGAITPWPILVAALLLSIGLSILFKRSPVFKIYTHNDFYKYAKYQHQDQYAKHNQQDLEIKVDEKDD